MAAYGALILPVVTYLKERLKPWPNFSVYSDHVGEPAQTIYCIVGEDERAHRDNQLAHVDIIVADARGRQVVLAIQIEETGATPKKYIGDIMAVCLSDAAWVAPGGRYAITSGTDFWVCFPATPKGGQRTRNDRVIGRLNALLRGAGNVPNVTFIVSDRRGSLAEDIIAQAARWVACLPAGHRT